MFDDFNMDNFYLPSQFGNPVKLGEQNVHLSPITLFLQGHFPVSSSQEISLEPSSLHSQAEILIVKNRGIFVA